jgi:hypothetical protein
MRAGYCYGILFLSALACASPAIAGGSAVKARLSSTNAAEQVSGVLTLNGYDLAGHLSGGGIDVTITGTVKSSSVSVLVTGRIVSSCSLHDQSMNGEAQNEGTNTSVQMTFQCVRAYVGGDYLFQLDLDLPPLHLQIPAGADPGEDA